MLEGPLAGEDHGGPGLVAGFDHFEIPQRAAGLDHTGNPLAQSYIHAVPEGKKGVGDHHGPGQTGFVLLGSPVDGFFIAVVPPSLGNGQFEFLIRDPIGVKTYPVGILGVSLEDRYLGHAHPVLFAGADAHRAFVLDVKNGVGGHPLLDRPAEIHVSQLFFGGRPFNPEFLSLVGAGSQGKRFFPLEWH